MLQSILALPVGMELGLRRAKMDGVATSEITEGTMLNDLIVGIAASVTAGLLLYRFRHQIGIAPGVLLIFILIAFFIIFPFTGVEIPGYVLGVLGGVLSILVGWGLSELFRKR